MATCDAIEDDIAIVHETIDKHFGELPISESDLIRTLNSSNANFSKRAKLTTPRWSIKAQHLRQLEEVFKAVKAPSYPLRQALAEQMGVTPRQVQVWFRNRRQRVRLSKLKESTEEPDDNDESVCGANVQAQIELPHAAMTATAAPMLEPCLNDFNGHDGVELMPNKTPAAYMPSLPPKSLSSAPLQSNSARSPMAPYFVGAPLAAVGEDDSARSEAASEETVYTAPASPLSSAHADSDGAAATHFPGMVSARTDQLDRAMELVQALERQSADGQHQGHNRTVGPPMMPVMPMQHPFANPLSAFEPRDQHLMPHDQRRALHTSELFAGQMPHGSAGMHRTMLPPSFGHPYFGPIPAMPQYCPVGYGKPFNIPEAADSARVAPYHDQFSSPPDFGTSDIPPQYLSMLRRLPPSQAQALAMQLQLQSRLFPGQLMGQQSSPYSGHFYPVSRPASISAPVGMPARDELTSQMMGGQMKATFQPSYQMAAAPALAPAAAPAPAPAEPVPQEAASFTHSMDALCDPLTVEEFEELLVYDFDNTRA